MEQSSIVTRLKDFLKDYSLDINSVVPNPNAGYPLKDAIFDRILFTDFCKHLRKIEEFDLWIALNERMDTDVESKDYKEATKVWNKICNLITKKVKHLLGGK